MLRAIAESNELYVLIMNLITSLLFQAYYSPRGGSFGEPGLRDGPFELRHEQLVHKPSARTNRTLDEIGQIFDWRAYAAEETGRGGCGVTSESFGCKVDNSDARTGQVFGYTCGRTLQARSLPILVAVT